MLHFKIEKNMSDFYAGFKKKNIPDCPFPLEAKWKNMSPSVNIQSDGHLPPPLWVPLFLYIFLRIDMLSHCSCFSMKKKIHISLLVSVVSGHCSQPLGLSPPPPSFDLMLTLLCRKAFLMKNLVQTSAIEH